MVWKSISTDGMCLPNQVHALQAQIWGIICKLMEYKTP